MTVKKTNVSCGCGCFTVVIEAIAFMLICNFAGCDWAEKSTAKLVSYVHTLWNNGTR